MYINVDTVFRKGILQEDPNKRGMPWTNSGVVQLNLLRPVHRVLRMHPRIETWITEPSNRT